MTQNRNNVVDLFSHSGVSEPFRRVDPARLRDARKAMGLNQSELAILIGVTRQSVSQWEQGAKHPDGATLFRLAEVLQQPLSYFTGARPEPFGQSSGAFYRAFGASTKKRNDQCDVWKEWLVQTASFFSSAVRLPKLELIDWAPEAADGSYTDEELECAARACRRHWGLGDGPIANVVALLESKGIICTRVDFGADQVNAFSYWNGDRPFIFLSSDKGSCARARFDASHELAHLTLHRGLSPDEFEDPQTLKRIEREADRFSSAFLMPEETFAHEVLTSRLEAFIELKRRWKVSVQAQVFRCEDLGLFSESQILNMRKSISKRRWKTHEPLDDTLPLEQPTMLKKCIELVVNSQIIDRHHIASGINLNPLFISRLCNTDTGFFGAEPSLDGPSLK